MFIDAEKLFNKCTPEEVAALVIDLLNLMEDQVALETVVKFAKKSDCDWMVDELHEALEPTDEEME